MEIELARELEVGEGTTGLDRAVQFPRNRRGGGKKAGDLFKVELIEREIDRKRGRLGQETALGPGLEGQFHRQGQGIPIAPGQFPIGQAHRFPVPGSRATQGDVPGREGEGFERGSLVLVVRRERAIEGRAFADFEGAKIDFGSPAMPLGAKAAVTFPAQANDAGKGLFLQIAQDLTESACRIERDRGLGLVAFFGRVDRAGNMHEIRLVEPEIDGEADEVFPLDMGGNLPSRKGDAIPGEPLCLEQQIPGRDLATGELEIAGVELDRTGEGKLLPKILRRGAEVGDGGFHDELHGHGREVRCRRRVREGSGSLDPRRRLPPGDLETESVFANEEEEGVHGYPVPARLSGDDLPIDFPGRWLRRVASKGQIEVGDLPVQFRTRQGNLVEREARAPSQAELQVEWCPVRDFEREIDSATRHTERGVYGVFTRSRLGHGEGLELRVAEQGKRTEGQAVFALAHDRIDSLEGLLPGQRQTVEFQRAVASAREEYVERLHRGDPVTLLNGQGQVVDAELGGEEIPEGIESVGLLPGFARLLRFGGFVRLFGIGQFQADLGFAKVHGVEPVVFRRPGDETPSAVVEAHSLDPDREAVLRAIREIDLPQRETRPERSIDEEVPRDTLGGGGLQPAESGDRAEARSIQDHQRDRHEDQENHEHTHETTAPFPIGGRDGFGISRGRALFEFEHGGSSEKLCSP